MVRKDIEKAVRAALAALGAGDVACSFEYPPPQTAASYASNAALAAAKQLDNAPRQVAEKIKAAVQSASVPHLERVEVAGPGFLNFFLTQEYFSSAIVTAREGKEKWGRTSLLSGMRVMVEYTDPNPFKEFHIGHLMSNAIGESISRLIESCGAQVKRANYQGDVGMHVAKALWGMRKLMVEHSGQMRDTALWGKAYALGALAYEENAAQRKEMEHLNRAVYEKNDPAVNALYGEGRAASLGHFEELYKMLGTKFDFYFFESEMAQPGVELVRQNIGRVFEESDGAMVFRGETAGLHTRVFLNALGLPTYEAKELALAPHKQKIWSHDRSVVITASEINDYFRVVLAALTELFPNVASKVVHLGHGFLRLPSGKMSSRTGSIITGESLLSEMREEVKRKMSGRELPEKEKVAEAVAVAAIKYAILKQSTNKDIIFDKERALSFEGDSGPYIQYAHTRCSSLLRKALQEGVEPSTAPPHSEAGPLERLLVRFPEIVERAAREYEPHHVAQYLIELSGAFNAWYAGERVLGSREARYKLALVDAVRQTLKNGLWLLGCQAPEEM